MKSTPFLVIEDNKILNSGRIASQVDQGYWLVQFDQPRAHSRILPTLELARFVVFRSDEERNAFVAPPVEPSNPESKKEEDSRKDIEERQREQLAKARVEFEKKMREALEPERKTLLDSQPQVPSGN